MAKRAIKKLSRKSSPVRSIRKANAAKGSVTPKKTKIDRTAGKAPPATTRNVPRGTNALPREIEVIARAVLIHGSRVLLMQNRKHGYYALPGGHVEIGEPAATTCARELLEECGLPITVGPLLLVSEGSFSTRKRAHHEINLVFHAEHRPDPDSAFPTNESLDQVRSLEDAISIEWVELASIVDLDVRPAAVKAFLSAGPSDAARSLKLAEWHSNMSA